MANHYMDATKVRCQNFALYKAFRELGEDKFYIELVENFPCENMEQLLAREGHYIRQLNSYNDGYNMNIAGRTYEQYCIDNRGHILQRMKNYREQNKDKRREYKEQNKDIIRQKNKEYDEKNKEKISLRKGAKITCECGCEISRSSKIKHIKSQKHIEAMAKLSQS
jgi:hypothetical protein